MRKFVRSSIGMAFALSAAVVVSCSSDDADESTPPASGADTDTDTDTVVESNNPGAGGATRAPMDPEATNEGTSSEVPLSPGATPPASTPTDATDAADGNTVADGTMTFFVTSAGLGDGGNLGGLEGADEFCAELAVAANPALAERTWRAYLSTSSVNARERIGTGPWHNQAGVQIASNLEALHDQAPAGQLDQTWAPMDLAVPLDELGNPVENAVHDILTGSLEDGTVAPGLTCDDWTSSDGTLQGQVGHSNRSGGMRAPSWTTTHPVGCGASEVNRTAGTVTQGGGRGSIYCFAVISGE